MASLNFNQGIQPDQKDKKSIKKEKICFIADFQIGEEGCLACPKSDDGHSGLTPRTLYRQNAVEFRPARAFSR